MKNIGKVERIIKGVKGDKKRKNSTKKRNTTEYKEKEQKIKRGALRM